jgi:trans-aconitate methyltransferase
MNPDIPIEHVWKAEDYHNNSSAQQNGALELLKYVRLKGNEQILDVGCGDGKITAQISGMVAQGRVLGVDLSPEMILFAGKTFGKFPNLSFMVQDAQMLDYDAMFDVVFSSFAIQWVPDQGAFFRGAYKSLKPSGCLALTVPLSISLPLEQTIREITGLPEWENYFINFTPKQKFNGKQVFSQQLQMYGFMPVRLVEVPQEAVFSSRDGLERYILQWFSYLKQVPEELQGTFFKQIMDRYFELEPLGKEGEAFLKFSRLDIVAFKI